MEQTATGRLSYEGRQRRMERKLGMALFRDHSFEMVLHYGLVLMLLLAIIAGVAESYASHEKYYPYNLDVPRRLL